MERPRIQDHQELEVYRMAFEAAMRIFEVSKGFPREERYSLTDQIRRSSRSVCANLAEAWRKRRYEGAFLAKLSDAEAEAAETQTWLDFAVKCSYLDSDTRDRTASELRPYPGQAGQHDPRPVDLATSALEHSGDQITDLQGMKETMIHSPFIPVLTSAPRHLCSSSPPLLRSSLTSASRIRRKTATLHAYVASTPK